MEFCRLLNSIDANSLIVLVSKVSYNVTICDLSNISYNTAGRFLSLYGGISKIVFVVPILLVSFSSAFVSANVNETESNVFSFSAKVSFIFIEVLMYSSTNPTSGHKEKSSLPSLPTNSLSPGYANTLALPSVSFFTSGHGYIASSFGVSSLKPFNLFFLSSLLLYAWK